MTIPNAQQLTLLKKYLYEFTLLVLGGCVATLFFKYDNLQIYVRDKALNESVENRIVAKQSADAIAENTKALNRINYLLETISTNTLNKKEK